MPASPAPVRAGIFYKQNDYLCKKTNVMITDKIIKKQFIVETVRRNAGEVRRIQLERLGSADERIRKKFNIDDVIASVQSNSMTVSEQSQTIPEQSPPVAETPEAVAPQPSPPQGLWQRLRNRFRKPDS
jgi:hypothetical protein